MSVRMRERKKLTELEKVRKGEHIGKRGKKCENERENKKERVFDARQAVSSHQSGEREREDQSSSSYLRDTQRTIPKHLLPHTFSRFTQPHTHTTHLSSAPPLRRAVHLKITFFVIIYSPSVSFQPRIIFFLLWNTKGGRNIIPDLFHTSSGWYLYC